MKTTNIKPAEIKKKWLLIDAAEQPVGRIASQIAYLLRGKHKPSFTPHLDCGDNVIVVNAEKVHMTGNKWKDKSYYHHTGYMGGIKTISAQQLKDKHPERIIQTAVRGMIPKNKLGRKIMKNLRIYVGAEHEQKAQAPEAAPARTLASSVNKTSAKSN